MELNTYEIKNDKVVFLCGCEFVKKNNHIVFSADLHKNPTINFDCPYTYQILSDGLTQGIFQLCSPLGTTWCSKLKPATIEHLSALGAILRPGCMEAKDDKGISTTIHYERRKNGKEETPSYHPEVDKALEDTYNSLIYQEGAMEVARRCAGFNLQEADSLRKAIGKKLPEEMAKSKKLFLEKCRETKILSDAQAEEVFSWIEASQRYAFCHAHALSYGIIGYITAYIKGHFPIQFYKEWLRLTDKREDYAGLINEAKLFDIYVHCPDIRELRSEFYAKGRNIYFGLSDIKGILAKDLLYLAERFTALSWDRQSLGKSISWLEFLSQVLESVSSRTTEGLIGAGALDCFGLDRAVLLYEYERWNRLSPKEKQHPFTACQTVTQAVKCLLICMEVDLDYDLVKYKEDLAKREQSGKIYKTTLKEPRPSQRMEKVRILAEELGSPLYKVVDTVDSVVYAEENLLGVALTRHKTDEILTCVETANCLEILNGRLEYSVLKVKVESARQYSCKTTTEKGNNNMCFLTVSDKSSSMPAIAFSDQFAEYRHLLTQSNLVFIAGKVGKQGTFIIDRCYSV